MMTLSRILLGSTVAVAAVVSLVVVYGSLTRGGHPGDMPDLVRSTAIAPTPYRW
jgi:hypothetical protein